MTGFWYLATPYTNYPAGHHAAFEMACLTTARLFSVGVNCFSPIAHSHSVAKWLSPDIRHSHDFWMRVDAPLMDAAHGLIVFHAEGWEKSRGTLEEIRRFEAAGKPIVHWELGANVPMVLLPDDEAVGQTAPEAA